ncbi:MAG: CopD family protein [Bacteroidota bacterium]|nr:CopD family protein [Bacteroidota bacterium]
MDLLYVKSIHIIFVVSWFAALFYIVRLYIYATEAQTKDDIARPILTQQLLLMQRKLWYIIGWPAAIGTTIFGWWMILLNPGYLYLPWMWLKLIAVGFLYMYHWQCQRILNQQKQGVYKFSSMRLRLLNELATIFLASIVFLVVVKSTSGLVWGMLGTFIFAGVLIAAVYIYKLSRGKGNTTSPTPNVTSEQASKTNESPKM